MKKYNKSMVTLVLLAFLSASCGGSGNDTQVVSGGIGGTGISQGTVEGFGSIILNGVKFNTDGATFTIDDNQTGTKQGDLRVGMQVTVQVDATGNTATTVTFEPEVEGPLDGKDPATNTLVVLGRTVVVDDSTVIEDDATPPITLTQAQLTTNDMLEVSGLVLADGSIQATHIKRKNGITVGPATELELKGTITSVNTGAKTLVIAGITINYGTNSPVFERMTEGDLAAGLLIEVKGTRAGIGASLVADEIKKEDGLGANDADKLEIEGVVSDFVSDSDFSINGQAVSTSGATTFEGGAKDDVIANVRLEVEGTLTNGILVAKKVKFRGNRIKIEADVTAIGTAPDSLTVLGKSVIINGLTEMDGLLFSAITTDRLKIRGYISKDGVVTATRVRTGNDGEITLQAPVEAISGTDLTLMGNNVTTAVAVFRDIDGNLLSSSEFFAQVSVGTLVKVKAPSGTNIAATEVEIED